MFVNHFYNESTRRMVSVFGSIFNDLQVVKKDAAGKIHNDFSKGFIAAETITYSDYIELGGEQQARENGSIRTEGKEYIVVDGDIIVFRFNV